MKQVAGIGVVLAVAVAAVGVIGGGSGATREAASPTVAPREKAQHRKPALPPAESAYRGGCTVFDPEDSSDEKDPKNAYPKDANRGAAKAVIDSFFAQSGTEAGLKQKPDVRYAIALAPDPRHTNLSLVFDREMVSVQQAAQDEGYTYNSSWFPWSVESKSYSSVTDQQRSEDETDEREACPGVILFRRSVHDVKETRTESGPVFTPANPPEPYSEGLVIFIVGEQPTGGLNEDQWNNAIAWLHNNASPDETLSRREGPTTQPRSLSVLGPYSSGTLVSLERALATLKPDGLFPSASTNVRILSGSIRGCSSSRWFEQRVSEARPAGATSFGSFQENDELQIYRLLNYIRHQGTNTSDVAILSEDETAYASAPPPANDPSKPLSANTSTNSPCDFPYALENRPVRFYYPRDISALRTAYEKQSVFSTGSGGRSLHPILQENAASEGSPSTASDTIPTYAGSFSPVAQEAILYGIVSHLRAHHTRYILLRCTNPLDFLFLTRFFHRAFPEGRVVTVGSDLLFRREIDTTEFRGVLALSNYPLQPRNQHWSFLTQKGEAANPGSHSHRVPDSHDEGIYLAARYILDANATWQPSHDHLKEPTLPFKEGIPDFADPFWMHFATDTLGKVQAPSWLTVVGRDGYWPIAVLSDASTPNEHLDSKPDNSAPAPPSTMVQVEGGRAHYQLTVDHKTGAKNFHPSLLLGAPLPWWALLFCGVLLLTYQTAVIIRGSKHTSLGLCAPFRRIPTPSQRILLGINCALSLFIFLELFSLDGVSATLNAVSASSNMSAAKVFLVVVFSVPLIAAICLRFRQLASWTFAITCTLLAIVTFITLHGTVTDASINSPNATSLFYRMGHVTSGASPLVPILFLFCGFYLWTWQALAGNGLLCNGRPLLPRLVPRAPKDVEPYSCEVVLKGLRCRWNDFWDTIVGILPIPDPDPDVPTLDRAYYRISHENAWNIIRVASPLSFPFTVVILPINILVAAGLFLVYNGPPLLSLESNTYAWVINLVLLLAFLLTIAEAARLYLTWVELRYLLTALNRLRLRRTFAKLRAVDGNSLWSVSGSVQRIQLLFFSQQLDAAVRLLAMGDGTNKALKHAIEIGEKFAENCARKTRTGPLWEKSVYKKGVIPEVYVRQAMNDAVANVLHELIPYWSTEKDSLSLENSASHGEDNERNTFDMELSSNPTVRTAEEFVCFHYIAFIQNVLARMRTMTLSMISLFISVCLAISFYPFVPRTGISMWMMINLLLIAASVVYVYAGMERDETLSYITNTRPGQLSSEFYLKTAGFLAGPIIGLLTTQFPAISETVLSWLQPGLDALK